jgi:DNA replication protein DnaC
MSMTLVEIQANLRRLRLSGMCETLEARSLQATQGNMPFIETFSSLIQDEIDRRDTRFIESRFRKSGLDERKLMSQFDWGFNPKLPRNAALELLTLKFVTLGENAMLIGSPGTGKSHIAKGVALAAIQSRYDVIYRDAQDLVLTFADASGLERRKILKTYSEADLLVIDDLFLRKIPPCAIEELQEVIFARYRKSRSTLVTSNRVIEDWGKLLGDAAAAAAILDRLLHNCKMLDFEGPSWRLKQAGERVAKKGRNG